MLTGKQRAQLRALANTAETIVYIGKSGVTENLVKQAADALRRLDTECAAWTGRLVGQLHLSAGFALAEDHAGLSAEALVKEADQAMYQAKAAYYARSGKDRRARSREEAGV